MLDVLIRNAQVIDGSGEPAVRGSVGVRAGRIVLDTDRESARYVIEADGLVVAPGFVDIHTHYDAQIMWDGSASPSTLHGVTTVIGGNCGFTIAPLRKDTTDYLMRMLAVVEGMPLAALQSGIAWNWESFGEYLGRLEGRLSINAGFLVGHSALRLAVMGKAAVGEKASTEQIAQMSRLLDLSLTAGGLGFSSTQKSAHLDANGVPVPSVYASSEELLALAAVLRGHPGTSLEFASEGIGNRRDASEDIELMTEMSRRAGRPINWNTIKITAEDPEFVELQLQAHDYSQSRGGRIVGLTNPRLSHQRACFGGLFPLNALPGWAPTFALDIEQRKRALADPDVRRRLRLCETAMLTTMQQRFVRWDGYEVAEGFSPAAKRLEGRLIGDLAREAGREPFDVLVDIALADELRTVFLTPAPDNSDAAWRLRAQIWLDPRTVVGGADSGAHLDMICGANYTTSFLQSVRERELVSWEAAVRQLTAVPARFYGLKDRGRIAQGWRADLVVFDPATAGPDVTRERQDLPGGASRLYAEATGIEHVFVNGAEVVRAGKATGRVPGHVLRSGRDTDGVSVTLGG